MSFESIGNSNNRLPKGLDNIKQKSEFSDVYEKICNWYGDKFNDTEINVIKSVWEKGCNEYAQNLNTSKCRIISNRIDKGLFELRYPKFINLDKKVIRQISNADTQRKFREVAINLYQNKNGLSDNDIKFIELQFSDAKIKGKIPNYDEILGKLSTNTGGNVVQDNDDNSADLGRISNPNNFNNRGRISNNFKFSENEKKELVNTVPQSFLDLKAEILPDDLRNDNDWEVINVSYLKFAKSVCDDLLIKELSEKQKEIIKPRIIAHIDNILAGKETDLEGMVNDTKDQLITDNPELLRNFCESLYDENDEIDYYGKASEYITQDDTETIKFLVSSYDVPEETAKVLVGKYVFFKEKSVSGEKLSEKEIAEFNQLIKLFGEGGQIKRLQEIKKTEESQKHKYEKGGINIDEVEQSVKMKSIEPKAIIATNQTVHNFVYQKNEKAQFDEMPQIEGEYREQLYHRLLEQKKGDSSFTESAKYIKPNGEIDTQQAENDGIDIESLKINQRTINDEINNLAKKEYENQNIKNRLDDICTRKSIMTCCFRAISQYFDQSNTNGENFAENFEFNVNDDIVFDENTGILSMKGNIGRNHVGLYYNITTGELSFDDFLGYDIQSQCYCIGKGNGQTKTLDIKLPTMNEMIEKTKTINKNLIHDLSTNNFQYGNKLEFAMESAIWLGCFRGFIGTDMEVNKLFVQQFNEKNILKQDIIKNIYSKFYGKNTEELFEGKILIGENTPGQYQLIKLIYDSIDNCKDANELLKFRNLINELDVILNDKNLVLNDDLLKYLFANDTNDEEDMNDNSKDIISNENINFGIQTDQSNQGVQYQGNNSSNNKSNLINYSIFLNLVSEQKGQSKYINLDTLQNAINTIHKTDTSLLDSKKGLFYENYKGMVSDNTLPELDQSLANTNEYREIIDNTRDNLADLGLDIQVGTIA